MNSAHNRAHAYNVLLSYHKLFVQNQNFGVTQLICPIYFFVTFQTFQIDEIITLKDIEDLLQNVEKLALN